MTTSARFKDEVFREDKNGHVLSDEWPEKSCLKNADKTSTFILSVLQYCLRTRWYLEILGHSHIDVNK